MVAVVGKGEATVEGEARRRQPATARCEADAEGSSHHLQHAVDVGARHRHQPVVVEVACPRHQTATTGRCHHHRPVAVVPAAASATAAVNGWWRPATTAAAAGWTWRAATGATAGQ